MSEFKMWVEEGSKIVILEDVDFNMGGEEFIEKMMREFNEEESEIIEDLCYEGVKLEEEEYEMEWKGIEVKRMKFEEYINEMKEWCKNYLV